jgi:hypothetical protein
MTPDLDDWVPRPVLRVAHRRRSRCEPERLWSAARSVKLNETAVLGRLIRWRIPGTPRDIAFDELFRRSPFTVLDERDGMLVSGLVGPIWTLRRDYPELAGPEEFRDYGTSGTAKVVFANWVEALPEGGAVLASESRVAPIGGQGRLGVAAVRPLVSAFGHLVGSDGIAAAVWRAEMQR